MTKRKAGRHLLTAYDHLLAAAPRFDGDRHRTLLGAIGTVRTIRRELLTPRRRNTNGFRR